VKRILKTLMMYWLPTAGHRWLRARKDASPSNDHRDPVFIRVTPQIVFETYWKDVEAGRGPALIVWLDYRKIVKFDCFGKGHGHYHIALPALFQRSVETDRIYLPEETIALQIERVVFELRTNLRYYLQHCRYGRARRAKFADAELLPAVARARQVMCRHSASAFPGLNT
jgi:hypothetical protein